jgi:hypothetical protein
VRTQGAVAENSYLAGEAAESGPLDQVLANSITYRIAVGPQQGRKVAMLRTHRFATNHSMRRLARWPGSSVSSM